MTDTLDKFEIEHSCMPREWLARTLHYLEAKKTSVYNKPNEIDTSWEADGVNRRLWLEYGIQVVRALRAVSKLDLQEAPTAAQIEAAIAAARKELET